MDSESRGSVKNSKTKIPKRFLANSLLWILGLAWLFTLDVLLHESGHMIFALLTGSKVVEFSLSPPRPHVTIDYYSVASRNLALIGGFVFTFFPYLFAFLYSALEKKRWVYLMIWPLLATFPKCWGGFQKLGFPVAPQLMYIVVPISLVLFLSLNLLEWKRTG